MRHVVNSNLQIIVIGMQEQEIDGGVGVWCVEKIPTWWAGITGKQSAIMQCRIISDGWVKVKTAFRMMSLKHEAWAKSPFPLLIPCIIEFSINKKGLKVVLMPGLKVNNLTNQNKIKNIKNTSKYCSLSYYLNKIHL